MIHVLAVITARPGRRAEILKAFEANVAKVRAEAGCIEYGGAIDADGIGPFRSLFGPDTFVVVEKWESAAALEAHLGAPHMKSYAATTKELIEDRAIHVLSPVVDP